MKNRQFNENILKVLKENRPDVYEDLRNTLKYYDSAYVEIENGRLQVSTSICIKSQYNPTDMLLGEFDRSYFEYSQEELNKAYEELSRCQWF